MIIKDQLSRTFRLDQMPNKIVSLVPSHTELLADLTDPKYIIGRTKFCIHPSSLKLSTTLIGGTKNLHIDRIRELNPDIIFANKEENNQEDIELLEKQFPVYVSEIKTLNDSYQFIQELAQIFNETLKAETIIRQSQQSIASQKQKQRQKAVYLIWKKPYMSIGNDTYIHDVMDKLGFDNAFANERRYPETSIAIIKSLQPDIILLSSEPYPFNISDMNELNEHFPTTDIQLVNGEFFSWYGSRIPKLDSIKILE